MKIILRICIPILFICFLSGCYSGTSQVIQKERVPVQERQHSVYAVLMTYTSLHDFEAQTIIRDNVKELLVERNLFEPSSRISNADYIIVLKLVNFHYIGREARFQWGVLAGTDNVMTEVAVVKPDILESEEFEEIYNNLELAFVKVVDGVKYDDRVARACCSMTEAHLLAGTVNTNHKSVQAIDPHKLVRLHAQEIVTFVAGKQK